MQVQPIQFPVWTIEYINNFKRKTCFTPVFMNNSNSPVKKIKAYLKGTLYFEKVAHTELIFKQGWAGVLVCGSSCSPGALWPRLGRLVQLKCILVIHNGFTSFQLHSTTWTLFFPSTGAFEKNPSLATEFQNESTLQGRQWGGKMFEPRGKE